MAVTSSHFDTAIIGGGIAGAATADRLSQRSQADGANFDLETIAENAEIVEVFHSVYEGVSTLTLFLAKITGENHMAWIQTIQPEEATGRLKEIYELTKSPHGTYDNVYISKSLRPETIMGHDTLYRSVLHHPDVTLPLWFLELVATYTSVLNQCVYAATHHGSNYRSLLDDAERAKEIDAAMEADRFENVFSGKELEFLRYTRKLTLTPGAIVKEDIEAMRIAGASDGEILEVNQTCACFSYSNRSLSGLGVDIGDDRVGYY